METLRTKQGLINQSICADQAHEQEIMLQLSTLSEKLSRLQSSLKQKYAVKAEYDQLIGETEAAYLKIVSSSQTLLEVLNRQTSSIG